MEDITVRVLHLGPPVPTTYQAEHALAFGTTARANAAARLLLAIAEQERNEAQADAYAMRENRDALEIELRAARLRENEDRNLICAARNYGREQEKEIEQAVRTIECVRRGRENVLGLLNVVLRRLRDERAKSAAQAVEIKELHGLLTELEART